MKCFGMAIDVDSAYLTFFSLSSTAGKEKNVLQIFTPEKLQVLHLKDGTK